MERLALEINTMLPARVVSFNEATARAKIEIVTQFRLYSGEPVEPVVIENVPVFFYGGRNGRLSTEIQAGEGGLVWFSQRMLDNFKDGALEGAGLSPAPSHPEDIRRFSLQDGVFLPGYFAGQMGGALQTGVRNDAGPELTLAGGPSPKAALSSGAGEVAVSDTSAEMKTTGWELQRSLKRARGGGQKNDESALAAAVAPWPGLGAVVALKNSILQTIESALEAIALNAMSAGAQALAGAAFQIFGKVRAAGVDEKGNIMRPAPTAPENMKPALQVAIETGVVAYPPANTPSPLAADGQARLRRGWALRGLGNLNAQGYDNDKGAGDADWSGMSVATGPESAPGANDPPRAYDVWADLVAFFIYSGNNQKDRYGVFSWPAHSLLGGVRRLQLTTYRPSVNHPVGTDAGEGRELVLDIDVPPSLSSTPGTPRPDNVRQRNSRLFGFTAKSRTAVDDWPSGWASDKRPVILVARFFDYQNEAISVDPKAMMPK